MTAEQLRKSALPFLVVAFLSIYPAKCFSLLHLFASDRPILGRFAPATPISVARTGLAPVFASPSCDGANNGGEDDDPSADRELDGDPDFLDDLKRAAASKLGADLPAEAVAEAASSAESEFLAAMRDVSTEFEDAKAELGSDGAVDMFIRRIDEEDDRRARGDGEKDDMGDWQ